MRLPRAPATAVGEHRNRRGETLFIDARKLGHMIDRAHRDLSPEDIARVAGTYHAWRGKKGLGEYADVPGFCKTAFLRLQTLEASGLVDPEASVLGAPPIEGLLGDSYPAGVLGNCAALGYRHLSPTPPTPYM